MSAQRSSKNMHPCRRCREGNTHHKCDVVMFCDGCQEGLCEMDDTFKTILEHFKGSKLLKDHPLDDDLAKKLADHYNSQSFQLIAGTTLHLSPSDIHFRPCKSCDSLKRPCNVSLTCQRCLNKKIKNPGPCVPNPTLQGFIEFCRGRMPRSSHVESTDQSGTHPLGDVDCISQTTFTDHSPNDQTLPSVITSEPAVVSTTAPSLNAPMADSMFLSHPIHPVATFPRPSSSTTVKQGPCVQGGQPVVIPVRQGRESTSGSSEVPIMDSSVGVGAITPATNNLSLVNPPMDSFICPRFTNLEGTLTQFTVSGEPVVQNDPSPTGDIFETLLHSRGLEPQLATPCSFTSNDIPLPPSTPQTAMLSSVSSPGAQVFTFPLPSRSRSYSLNRAWMNPQYHSAHSVHVDLPGSLGPPQVTIPPPNSAPMSMRHEFSPTVPSHPIYPRENNSGVFVGTVQQQYAGPSQMSPLRNDSHTLFAHPDSQSHSMYLGVPVEFHQRVPDSIPPYSNFSSQWPAVTQPTGLDLQVQPQRAAPCDKSTFTNTTYVIERGPYSTAHMSVQPGACRSVPNATSCSGTSGDQPTDQNPSYNLTINPSYLQVPQTSPPMSTPGLITPTSISPTSAASSTGFTVPLPEAQVRTYASVVASRTIPPAPVSRTGRNQVPIRRKASRSPEAEASTGRGRVSKRRQKNNTVFQVAAGPYHMVGRP